MSARDDIAQLIYLYAERIDLGDFNGVGELLAHAIVSFEGHSDIHSGKQSLAKLYEFTTRRYGDGTPKTKHVTTNVIIEIDAAFGIAHARSYFTVFQAVPGELALQPIIAGRYHDEFIVVDGNWRFDARHVIVDLVGDLSQHLSITLV